MDTKIATFCAVGKLVCFVSKIAWLLVFSYAGLIFYFSSLPGDTVPDLFANSDIVFHTLEYFPFGFLIVCAFMATWKLTNSKYLLFLLFVVMLYALSDEVHQIFVPGRTFSLADLIFDCIGSMLGGLSFVWLKSNPS